MSNLRETMSRATNGYPLWEPTLERTARANITRYREFLRVQRGLDLPDYEALWHWSVQDLEGFWASIWDFFALDAISPFDQVLADEAMPGAQWFSGANINFAQYILDQGDPYTVAVVGADETGEITTWTRGALREQVGSLAAWLRRAGVGTGDVVVGYVPNIGEAVVAFLAVASVGAVWSSVGQDYAAAAAVDRFAQLEPKVLIAADGYHFNGRWHSRIDAVAQLQAGLPSLHRTVMVNRGDDAPANLGWDDWLEALAEPAEVASLPVPFDHPLWVLFSSGTTGLPKGLVHGHGGILVETLKQMALHWDLGEEDRLFWYTSPSWVMWNLQLSALACGGSIVCYDGSPTSPDPSALWRIVSELGVTFFGTSPGFLQASRNAGLRPGTDLDLSLLRSMGSTGSPLSPQSHQWAYDEVGPIPLWSMSGGTDIAGAFVGGSPITPIWPGELSAPCLGVALEAWNEDGQPVIDEVGELIVHRPMPSMPVQFWNDPDASRYVDAYYSSYPGVWRQGDWITITARGSVVIHGRSDSTINRNGVRMGSADIYAALEGNPAIADALVIGAEQDDGSYWMPLFVTLADGRELDEALIDQINASIRELASPRHVPDQVIAVSGIPRTRTGKKLEVPVKRLLQGVPLATVVNPSIVDNPELLAEYAAIAADRR